MALLLKPLANSQLILSGTEKLRLLFGMDAALRHGVSTIVYPLSPQLLQVGMYLRRRVQAKLFPVAMQLLLAF